MTSEQIIELAKHQKWLGNADGWTFNSRQQLITFANAIAQRTREEVAQVGEPCPLCHAREVLVTTEIVGRQIDDLLNPTTEPVKAQAREPRYICDQMPHPETVPCVYCQPLPTTERRVMEKEKNADAAEYRRQLDGCDREADRVRFPDLAFNQWLDEGISDAGHTVWDQLSNICDAWHGWINSALYTEPVKAQAGEPVGYHFSYTTPFGHVVWDIDYTPRPDAIEVYPVVRAHPTTERPYNPLNDYAVISMNPTTERRVPEDFEAELAVYLESGAPESMQDVSVNDLVTALKYYEALSAAPAPTKEMK